jgi:uncharacterized membrane protein (DUF485 family)
MKLVKIKGYIVRNLGAPFIIAFQALILACAFLVIQGNPVVDVVAVFAFGFLVVGVVLQAVGSIRQKALGG